MSVFLNNTRPESHERGFEAFQGTVSEKGHVGIDLSNNKVDGLVSDGIGIYTTVSASDDKKAVGDFGLYLCNGNNKIML